MLAAMKVWVLWRVAYDDTDGYSYRQGLADVVAVALDKEEAEGILRAKSIAWARENPRLFEKRYQYEMDAYLLESKTNAELLSDEEIEICFASERHPFEVHELELESIIDLNGMTDAARVDAVRGLADILRAFNQAAGEALASTVKS
jgi:hypothetical protein